MQVIWNDFSMSNIHPKDCQYVAFPNSDPRVLCSQKQSAGDVMPARIFGIGVLKGAFEKGRLYEMIQLAKMCQTWEQRIKGKVIFSSSSGMTFLLHSKKFFLSLVSNALTSSKFSTIHTPVDGNY